MAEILAAGEKVKIKFSEKEFSFPAIIGTEGERAVDISELRAQTSHITYDPGYANTGACLSSITFIDGEKGILRYRGIPIEQLAERSTFVETSHLLIHGKLPTQKELSQFSQKLTEHAPLHEDVKKIFSGIPKETHPMATLSGMVSFLSGFYPTSLDPKQDEAQINESAAQLISKVRTIAAYIYRKSVGESFVPPNDTYSYCANFLHMMFSGRKEKYILNEEAVKALNLLLILHADHEQNCSASTVRLVGSSRTNLFASIAAGICALWGPLHGGANQEVMEMLEQIHTSGKGIEDYIRMATEPKSQLRLFGFGHRVYKTYDPRAKVIKDACYRLIEKFGVNDPLLEIALKLERAALKNEFFITRHLYPNVDFYSGIIYKILGIPTNMFTVMFAIGRLPGWIAHWKEMRDFKPARIGRPRQIYTGRLKTDYVPIEARTGT